jgi:hypothetical protein
MLLHFKFCIQVQHEALKAASTRQKRLLDEQQSEMQRAEEDLHV